MRIPLAWIAILGSSALVQWGVWRTGGPGVVLLGVSCLLAACAWLGFPRERHCYEATFAAGSLNGMGVMAKVALSLNEHSAGMHVEPASAALVFFVGASVCVLLLEFAQGLVQSGVRRLTSPRAEAPPPLAR